MPIDYSEIERAFELYINREFPDDGIDGNAFNETPAIDHFIEGWRAALKAEAPHA